MADFLPPIDIYKENPYIAGPIEGEKTSEELCAIAQMDAWHDHHTIEGLPSDMIQLLVQGHTPLDCNKPQGNEDIYMYSKLCKEPKDFIYCKPPPRNIDNTKYKIQLVLNSTTVYKFENERDIPFSNWVTGRYTVRYCYRESGNNTGNSFIQEALRDCGITEDYFFIKDTAKSNYSSDISKTTGNQIVTNILTSAGIYDPGPTTTPYTPAGSEHGFNEKDTKSRFGILDFSKQCETAIHYPSYKDDGGKYEPFEKLLYSKYDCTMIATTDGKINDADARSYITKTNSTFYIKENETIFYVDKNSSDKATDVSELSFNEKLKAIGSLRLPAEVTTPLVSKIAERSGVKKIFSKKVGDHGQANQTLRPVIYYQEYLNGTLVPKKTNGIHGFVSYDRVAITSAIYYGSPIVVYITDAGFVVYVSNNLIEKVSSPEVILTRKKEERLQKLEKIKSFRNDNDTNISIIETLKQKYTNIYNFLDNYVVGISDKFIESINPISVDNTGRLSTRAAKIDKAYKLWLSKLYIFHQLAHAIGTFLKLDMNPDNIIATYKSYTTNIDSFNITVSDDIEKVQAEKVQADIIKMDEILLAYNNLQSCIVHLETIEATYKDNIDLLNSYITLEPTNNLIDYEDASKIDKLIKKQNPQIATSIGDTTTAQSVVNPNCLSSLLSCFSSSKLVFSLGTFYPVYEFYQHTYSRKLVVEYFFDFMEVVKNISVEAKTDDLFNGKLYQLIQQLEEGTDHEVAGFGDFAKQQLQKGFDKIIQENMERGGNSKTRSKKPIKQTRPKNKRQTRRKKGMKSGENMKKIKGGNITGDDVKEYLEYISFLYIYNAFKDILDAIFQINLQLTNTLQYLDNMRLYTLPNANSVRVELDNKLNDANNTYAEFNEITRFNLFRNNIVGAINMKLLRFIELHYKINRILPIDIQFIRDTSTDIRKSDTIDSRSAVEIPEDMLIEYNYLLDIIRNFLSNQKTDIADIGFAGFIEKGYESYTTILNSIKTKEIMTEEQMNQEAVFILAIQENTDIQDIFISFVDKLNEQTNQQYLPPLQTIQSSVLLIPPTPHTKLCNYNFTLSPSCKAASTNVGNKNTDLYEEKPPKKRKIGDLPPPPVITGGKGKGKEKKKVKNKTKKIFQNKTKN